MKRRLPCLALAGSLCVAIASCGGSDGGPSAPGDATPPSVAQVSLPDGSTGVGLIHKIEVTFSEAMDTGSTERAVSVSSGSIAAMTWSSGDTVLTMDVSVGGGQKVVVTVSRAATDLAGNPIDEELTFYYRTEASEGQSTPGIGAQGAVLVLSVLGALAVARRRR